MRNSTNNKFFNLLILVVFTTLLFSACDKIKEPPTPVNDGCKLTQIDFYHDNFNEYDGSAAKFAYNEQGYIIGRTEEEGIPPKIFSAYNYVYNANNQLIRENYVDDSGRMVGFKTYVYNTDGTVKEIVNYQNGEEARTRTYVYDGSKRVIKILDPDEWYITETKYEYIGNSQNISTASYYRNDQLLRKLIYEKYDTKLNPIYAVKGYVSIGESKNNPLIITEIDAAQNRSIITYSYQYNDAGYLTEAIRKGGESVDDYKYIYKYSGCSSNNTKTQ